jgi:hypothetical protein
MKTNAMRLCVAILLVGQIAGRAQQTEISVQKGKVVAEVGSASVPIEAGRKAVLGPSGRPTVSVDNPFVRDALELHKLVEVEKSRKDLKIDSTFILVGSADADAVHGALYFEFPNGGLEATSMLTLPCVSIIPDLQVYDLDGNLLEVDQTLVDATTASYSIHVRKPVQAGEHFKLIGVANLRDMPLIPGGAPAYYKEGPLWHFTTLNIMPNCLNYFRFILPPSAILVDANRQVIATDCVDGRVAVTMRNYTGEYADGACTVVLLWPDHDGTTLADIPARYLGLRAAGDSEDVEKYRRDLARILAGTQFQDQSTPLAALLTTISAAIRQDVDVYRGSLYDPLSREQEEQHVKQAAYWAGVVDVLSVPPWPESPGDGYIHPVYMSRKGSLIHEFTQSCVYEDGKWYSYRTKSPGHDTPGETNPDRVEAAKAAGYLMDWEAAGPYIQKGKKGTELFDISFGPERPGEDVRWVPIPTEISGSHPAYVNLDKAFYGLDQTVAYLRTRIDSPAKQDVRLDIYTDDGVKAWLNGILIHANNVSRGVSDGPDMVAVTLKQGINELMLKVTDDILGWGAVVRMRPAHDAPLVSHD